MLSALNHIAHFGSGNDVCISRQSILNTLLFYKLYNSLHSPKQYVRVSLSIEAYINLLQSKLLYLEKQNGGFSWKENFRFTQFWEFLFVPRKNFPRKLCQPRWENDEFLLILPTENFQVLGCNFHLRIDLFFYTRKKRVEYVVVAFPFYC